MSKSNISLVNLLLAHSDFQLIFNWSSTDLWGFVTPSLVISTTVQWFVLLGFYLFSVAKKIISSIFFHMIWILHFVQNEEYFPSFSGKQTFSWINRQSDLDLLITFRHNVSHWNPVIGHWKKLHSKVSQGGARRARMNIF